MNDPLRALAESTEESAVRENYDFHNGRYARVMALVTIVIGAIGGIANLADGRFLRFLIAVALLTVAITSLRVSTGRSKLSAWFADVGLSAFLIGAFVIQIVLFGVVMIPHRHPGEIAVLGIISAWTVVLLRMPFARRVLVHATLVGLVILAVETSPVALRNRGDRYAPLIASHVCAMLAGGFISRRLRKNVLERWRERRAHAVEALRMRDELRFAREVQISMLPEAPPVLEWIDIAGVSIPATEVGGDYFDYFRVGDAVALVCGDVAGHGLASGIVLTALRSGFMLLRNSLTDPAAVLTQLHELIDQTSRRRMLATAAVAVLDPAARTVKIASAGHPPVLVRASGVVRFVELFGPPLGVRLPIAIADLSLPLSSGDVVVLHSDGVYETANPAGAIYGLDRLGALIEAATSRSAEDLRDAILRDVEAFRGAAPQEDDVTVVVAVLW